MSLCALLCIIFRSEEVTRIRSHIKFLELQLLTAQTHLNVKLALRGGTSIISSKYSKTNNPYVAGYHKDQERSYIMYLDENNFIFV